MSIGRDSVTARAAAWVREAGELVALARHLAGARELALDTEGDSLHHYPARLALVQLADDRGGAWLVDAIALGDLAALGAALGDPAILTVVHAGDNDLADLKRRHGLGFASVFDTSVAARFLGARALGLDVLVADYLGLELPPSRQKDDWSARPLSPAQERYAVADVEHLIALKDRLTEGLRRIGRLAWVLEECAALAAEPVPEVESDPEPWRRLKGAGELSPRGLAALRELHAERENLALALARPPFKILGNDVLVQLAGNLPQDEATLATVRGLTPRVVQRWGGTVLGAVERALSLREDELPVIGRSLRPRVDHAVTRRIDALRAWRAEAAPRIGLEPGVVLPNRLIVAIAQAAPRSLAELEAVPGVRRWRTDTLGAELLAALAAVGGRRG